MSQEGPVGDRPGAAMGAGKHRSKGKLFGGPGM